ncbi:MAG: TRAP transporter substrate-binding protein DctP [Rhizobiales bacterium]|nr:TRAP transporter substrate-binding protein DctP [Hyphomicrobiales bacterium]
MMNLVGAARWLLRGMSVAALGAILALPGPYTPASAQQQPQQMRFGTGAIGGDLPVEMMYIFKEWVDRSAPGEFDLQVHHTGTLVRQGTEITALQRNSVEMTILSWWDIGDRIPEFAVLTAGYLFKDWNHVKAVMDGDLGAEYKARIEKDLGIVILDYYYAGPRIVNLREAREVRTPADLAGVKLRMPGSPSFLLLGEALGATPVPMPLPDVYLALSTGTIDGQDNPLSTTYRAKFYEVTKQIVLTYHSIPANMLAINKAAWDKLTPRQQSIFRDAARAAMTFNDTNKFRDDEDVLEKMSAAGLTITTPDQQAFRDHVLKVFADSEYVKNAPAGWLERIESAAGLN